MNRVLTAIFCDDIRQEVGNKLSYVGCYTNEMVLPQFPFTLPKFCVLLIATTLESDRFKQLKFRLLKNDDVVAEIDIPSEALTAPVPARVSSNADGEELRQTVIQVIQLFPLQIDGPSKFRARAITESGELRGGSLIVSLAETAPT